MTNKITNAKRERIYARAKQLCCDGYSNGEAVRKLMSEFGISYERAQRAAGRVIREQRRK